MKFDPGDNVVVALEQLEEGDKITVNGADAEVIAQEPLPQGHKLADADISAGELIIKYGHSIGTAAKNIKKANMFIYTM